jgi:hypothetical protein
MKRTSVILPALLLGTCFAQQPAAQPRVYLQSSSKGNVWNAARDQSMEMAKDFQKNCPDVKITIAQNAADYTVMLNHIENGPLSRDNQFQIANKEGDMLGGVREKGVLSGGSIKGGVKNACQVIMKDWADRQAAAAQSAPAPAPADYQPGTAQVQSATQTTTDAPSQDPAAVKAQQLKACQDLAKDNPSIVCK